MYHKNSPEFLESCDTFRLQKHFIFKKISQIFGIQIAKSKNLSRDM